MPLVRGALYKLAGCDFERGVAVLGKLTFIGAGNIASRIHVGKGSIIAKGVVLGLDADITIGENVSISPYCTIFTATHQLGFGSRRMEWAVTPKPIAIENGCWIGMNSLILPGVTVGRGAVVSAGSVVKEDAPANTLLEGNPATVSNKLPFGNR